MRKIMLVLLSAVLLVILAACSKSQESSADVAATDAAASSDAVVAETANFAAAPPAPEAASRARSDDGMMDKSSEEKVTADHLVSSATSYVDGERKFVRTASADFRVKDVYQSAIAIENIVANQGGFVVGNQINSTIERVNRYPVGNAKLMELAEYTVRGNLTVRVPSARTQDFLRALVSQIEFLDQRNFEARDVQFELLRKQLEFLRNQEAQRQLGDLSTSPGKISDKAAVISGQNDAKANRDEAVVVQKEVEDKVAFSTISLSLYQLSKVRKTEVDDVDAIAKEIRPGFFSRMFSAVSVGWYALLDIVIDVIAIWPLWLLIGLVVFAVKRFRKK
ncbi:MAG TPA: DUF4349 domain-containing protein [Arenimonas sp.]|nr:DUF4349 domain-containing protein [Arenimonas sp.]HOZ04079.1 DUF4349 domain-containing protein [Arenimonas sp.]HPO23668.1 DUF4349 domain-containing protein [Arenimonas sp.]HPW31554.1 DUF4349 domain-containing protein [Arenimonas sp.]